ncbi:MAG: hypothetical protein M2R45_02143 [Verrucomicrobia subdivision 3 bacterium]|nr:hypothetical protein [Limisphaerales bacterium]MCS1413720.1 hypothetical protein [Limisphaerales bacterium]
MVTNTLVLGKVKIGEIFTPISWAQWLLDRWNVFDRWTEGESVCDPTAGTGIFAKALIAKAVRLRMHISEEMLGRLHIVELKNDHLRNFSNNVREELGISFPSTSLHQRDIITHPLDRKFDILVGNPPWSNFTDLPDIYKEILKMYFIEYGLVPNRKAVLLGSSRTDIAALVLKVVLQNMLKDNGDGYFYTPLSLFAGDDAHIGFRDYRSKTIHFSVKEVYEFTGVKIFGAVRTSYCAVHFKRNVKQTFPVSYYRGDGNQSIKFKAYPLKKISDPWRIVGLDENAEELDAIQVKIGSHQKPRQGVNTCGANSVFIFDSFPDFIDPEYIFPLASKEIWRERILSPKKWIFLPYEIGSSRPLSEKRIQSARSYGYLCGHKRKLKSRKGTLIRSAIDKGLWWSLLGVGPYSFAPYKVMWEAYGKHTFSPMVLGVYDGKPWQANQAMHAFIPCWEQKDAERICKELSSPSISRLLSELNGQGKCNFAQPGKIKKILHLPYGSSEQMLLLESKSRQRTRQGR